MSEKKNDPQFENIVKWLTEDWAHIGLVLSVIIIIALIIVLATRK